MSSASQPNRQNQRNCGDCTSALPFCYKALFICSAFLGVIGMVINIGYYNMVCYAFYKIGTILPWALFTSFLTYPYDVYFLSIIRLLIDCLWFYWFWPGIEKKYSSPYMFFYILLQNLIISLTFLVVSAIIYFITPTVMFSFGWVTVLFPMIWKSLGENPEQEIRFCCLPWLIKSKYIPFIVLAIKVLWSFRNLLSILVSFGIGFLEYMILKRDLIQLPMRFYLKFQNILPDSFKNRSDFVSAHSVKQSLTTQCFKCCEDQARQQTEFKSDKQNPIKIGGTTGKYKDVWINKDRLDNNENIAERMQERVQKEDNISANMSDFLEEKEKNDLV